MSDHEKKGKELSKRIDELYSEAFEAMKLHSEGKISNKELNKHSKKLKKASNELRELTKQIEEELKNK